MQKNFLLYDVALTRFDEDEEFYCSLVPKTVAFNIDIICYEHYVYKSVVRENQIIIVDSKDIYEELDEPLSNLFAACFFEDKELALYWKYKYTQHFIALWDNTENNYSSHKDKIRKMVNMDLKDKKIDKAIFKKFEQDNPDKVIQTMDKLRATSFVR